MSTTTASKAKAKFDAALSTLNALADYATDNSSTVPSVPGLTAQGQALLSRTGGKDIARSWAAVFADTIELVNKFHDEDLVNRTDVDEREIDRVAQTTLRATTALTGRLNSLG